MKKNAKFILHTIILLSVVMGAYDITLFIKEIDAAPMLYRIWSFVFIVLLVLWVSEDSKDYSGVYRPFDYGFLVLMFYIFYVPYYLIKTRGVVIGIAYLLGFFVLLNVGWFFQWPIYWLS